ncbi:MAG TPA: glycosyltransferase family 2 protein [Opitutaceae bacterium]|nr:glycosyltransferase family 2 protein [Opitutaceae bacterium]
MAPRVSVILPAYNAATSVGRAIASIRAQSLPDWELIVIDDGSGDETAAAASAAAAADARVRVVTRPHEGLVAALNAGLAAARAPLIARMDADDESHPERLAEQAAFLDRSPDAGLTGCLVEFAGDRNASAGYALHVDWINSITSPEEIALNRFIETPFAHPSVMFRRALVDAHGGYRAGDFPEDYELWLRWLAAGVRMAKVQRPLLRWHDAATRLSRTDPRYSPEAFFRLKAEWVAHALRTENHLDGRRLYVWGAGRPTRKRAAHLETHGLPIAGYVDIDPRKQTRALGGTGRPVLSPDALPPPSAAFVLGYVTSRGARDLIRDALRLRQFSEGTDFLLCG